MTKAGQKLFMAQPTVSFAISELEKHYGVKLFDRLSKRLYLTGAGSRLLPYARHIVSSFDEMEEGAQDWRDGGILRVGASITIGNCLLPGLLKSFAQSRPGVTVRIQIDNSGEIEQAVLDNRVDIGLIEGVPHSGQLISKAFRDDDLVLLFPPGHRWEARTEVRPEELAEEPFLMRERGSGGREMLESALRLHGVEVEPLGESVSTQAILQAVAGGLGVAVLPLLLAESHLKKGTLVTRPIEGMPMKRKFYIICHKNKYLTDMMREFMELCRSE